MNKISILYFIPSLNVTSGVTNHVMNYYRKIDHKKFRIDFLLMNNEDKTFNDEIEANNDNIYVISKPSLKGIFGFIKKLNYFFKNNSNKYDIVHSHSYNFGAFVLRVAKKNNVKTRILHMHVTKYSDNKLKSFFNSIIVIFAKKYSNTYFCCTDEAGRFAFKNNNYYVINNALDINKFEFNENIRNKIRKDLKIDDTCILFGNIGRLKEQKNHLFLIDIFNEYHKLNNNSRLLIIGNGPLKEDIVLKAKKANILNDIIFIDSTSNPNDYYQAMDLFVLPSVYEGLGIVLIEAQISGLPCYCSDFLPRKVFISDLCTGIALNNNANEWSKIIFENANIRKNVIKEIENNGFSIEKEVKKLERLYIAENER